MTKEQVCAVLGGICVSKLNEMIATGDFPRPDMHMQAPVASTGPKRSDGFGYPRYRMETGNRWIRKACGVEDEGTGEA
jgi:hypothetical protein